MGGLDTGPSFKKNVKNAPLVFEIFWGIGAAALAVNFYFAIIHINALVVAGNELKSKLKSVFMPRIHRLFLIVCSLPCVVGCCSYLTLLSPKSVYLYEFISYLYQSFALYQFGQLIIDYLGGMTFIMERLPEAGEVQLFVSGPCCCCCGKCCPAQVITEPQLRNIYNLIIQYAIALPVIMFAKLLATVRGGNTETVLQVLKAVSNQLAFYGLGALCIASQKILTEFNIQKKFKVVKFSVVASIIPSVIVSFIPCGRYPNRGYSGQTMKDAYGSFVTVILTSILSVLMRKYFPVSECLVIMQKGAVQGNDNYQRFKSRKTFDDPNHPKPETKTTSPNGDLKT